MRNERPEPDRRPPIVRIAVLAAIAWSVATGASLWWYVARAQEQALEVARHEAAAYIEKDMAFRRWATSHGGVYVPPDAHTPPNPYLDVPDRDVVTSSGKKLTLMNPAYMLRQLQTEYSGELGVKGRITSLRPVNPVNSPDPWESATLRQFEGGAREHWAVADVDGAPHLRLMKPFLVEQGCLKCHGRQGYKVGDVRGGLGVSLPLAPYYTVAERSVARLAAGHGIVWLLGLGTIAAVARQSTRRAAERESSLAALRRSNAEVKDLFNHAPCGYHSLDRDGLILRINDTELGWVGYRWDEVVGRKRFPELLTPEGAALFAANYRRFVEDGAIKDMELELVRRDGSRMWILYSATAVRGADGRFVSSRSTLYDIGERKQAEADVRRLNQVLEDRVIQRTAALAAANKELEAFSYSVSHDLRTPLRAIDGFSRILLEDYQEKLDEEGQRLLHVVRSNTVRMGQLIDDILAFSRLGRRDMASQRIDMAALVRAVFAELAALEPQRRIRLDVGSLPPAEGDPAMIRQVIANLLGNAVKFTRDRAEAVIEVGGRAEAGENVYWVKDNGVGFDMRYVDKLFGVFQRLHAAEEFDGTGIGLATVARVVNRHGGRVWAEGVPDAGATLYFSLPRRSEA